MSLQWLGEDYVRKFLDPVKVIDWLQEKSWV
jgi:hypothetical protein